MKKRSFLLAVLLVLTFSLSGCWAGEVKVDTTINTDGSGSRSFVLSVYDDSLQTDPITNLDDPEGTEGKGPIINSTHVTGGVSAIQTWLEDNSPTWMTVEEMDTVGIQRIFTLTFDFEDFDQFLARYKELVDLSPTLSWSDFTAEELPTFVCEGLYSKECTFTEDTVLVNASLDWAKAGIWEDIYLEADLAGYIGKDDIGVLADYVLDLNGETITEIHAYDADAVDGDGTGAVVNVTSDSFTLTTTYSNTPIIIVTAVVAAIVVGLGAFLVFKPKA